MAENFDLIFGSSASKSYSWNDSDYQNGWQTVGDTPPTREQFDALQRRADLKAQALNNRLTPIEENDTHDYRQPSTAYTAGQIKYHATLPTGWYLECTTAGTTDAGALTISGTVTPNTTTVSDGTVVWTVRQGTSTKNLGGFVNGNLIALTNAIQGASTGISIFSGTQLAGSPFISLRGGTYQVEDDRGQIEITTNNGTLNTTLKCKPNGTLTWAGNDLAGSAIVAKSLSGNGYVKYASGLIVQWGYTGSGTSSTVTYPVTFTATPKVIVAPLTGKSQFVGYTAEVRSASISTLIINKSADFSCYWIAIGY